MRWEPKKKWISNQNIEYTKTLCISSYWDQCFKYFITNNSTVDIFVFIYTGIYKPFITTPIWWKKKLSKQCWGSDLIIYIPCCWLFQHFKPSDEIPDWQSDMIMCEIFIHLVIAVLVNQFQFFFSLLKKILLSLFPSLKLKIYPSLDVKPQEVNLMHIQLIKLKSGFGFFVYCQYF